MARTANRRTFLAGAVGAGAALGLEHLGFLSRLPRVSAAEAQAAGKAAVRLDPSIEPIVRLIEDTPRDLLLEEMAARIRQGLSYQDVLAALFLAGVKNVEPRPSVGFKFHSVLVVNSCHLASLASPDEHRWLPIFWALDHYKGSAARDVEERGDWTMPPVDEAAVPAGHKARQAFLQAMEQWDEAAADAAIAGYARTGSLNEIYEDFFRLGARDFRAIGHKAIFVANSFRTLQCIGPQHAEPVLRSLTYALLMYEDGNPAENDFAADLPYRSNIKRLTDIRPEWRDGHVDRAATEELLATLRTASADEACDLVVSQLNHGVGPQSICDALQVAGGELLMRQTGIVSLHAMTTTNALQYAYRTTASDETRRLMLLQNAAFVPLFREAMRSRGSISDKTLADVQPDNAGGEQGRESIFAAMDDSRMTAARRTLGYLESDGSPEALLHDARVLVFLKGDDAHDYKFSSAVLEDFAHVSPDWRNLFLSLSTFNLRSAGERNNPIVERTRAAFA